MKILALCGGVGGAKLAHGLAAILPPDALTVIVNSGDDFEHMALPIWPDFDTVLYTLAGVAHRIQGWGRADETLQVMREVAALGAPDWFTLGDKDIALHLVRLAELRDGARPTDVAASLAARLGVRQRLLPMADTPVRTIVETEIGALPFQEYFVQRRCEPRITGFRFEGADAAEMTPETLAATEPGAVDGIVICPSNPYVSVDPILAVPGLRQRLRCNGAPIIAVSPIIAGQAVKGPAAKMMAELGKQVSARAVAQHYGELLDGFMLDASDAALATEASASGPRLFVAQTLMKSDANRTALARSMLDALAAIM